MPIKPELASNPQALLDIRGQVLALEPVNAHVAGLISQAIGVVDEAIGGYRETFTQQGATAAAAIEQIDALRQDGLVEPEVLDNAAAPYASQLREAEAFFGIVGITTEDIEADPRLARIVNAAPTLGAAAVQKVVVEPPASLPDPEATAMPDEETPVDVSPTPQETVKRTPRRHDNFYDTATAVLGRRRQRTARREKERSGDQTTPQELPVIPIPDEGRPRPSYAPSQGKLAELRNGIAQGNLRTLLMDIAHGDTVTVTAQALWKLVVPGKPFTRASAGELTSLCDSLIDELSGGKKDKTFSSGTVVKGKGLTFELTSLAPSSNVLLSSELPQTERVTEVVELAEETVAESYQMSDEYIEELRRELGLSFNLLDASIEVLVERLHSYNIPHDSPFKVEVLGDRFGNVLFFLQDAVRQGAITFSDNGQENSASHANYYQSETPITLLEAIYAMVIYDRNLDVRICASENAATTWALVTRRIFDRYVANADQAI